MVIILVYEGLHAEVIAMLGYSRRIIVIACIMLCGRGSLSWESVLVLIISSVFIFRRCMRWLSLASVYPFL